ncbi:MAG: BMP family ABC transporter substrate-binding protein, partial [Synergistaceae bacterium]|nr:BMP family ABC transporter substrate-binding protein [Synergistaceae bacterium]
MKKRILFLALLALAVGGVFILNYNDEEIETKSDWRPGDPLDKNLIKIGVIHVSDPENEKSGYAYAHYLGVEKMRKEIGLRDEQIINKVNVSDIDMAAAEMAMRECASSGVNIVFATSWNYMDLCEKLADEYPGVVFAHASGARHNDRNFTNYFGRIYQARYMSGVVAGLKTATGRIGYVAAMGKDNSEVTSGLDAFAMGVESVNPAAGIYVRVIHRWLDPAGESQAARYLIEEGCDVIAQHCNTPNPQIEAQRAGVWGIGYNSDMRNDAPDATVVSVLWDWGVSYSSLVKSVIDGTFTTAPYMGDIKDGMIGLTPFNERLLPPGAADVVKAARERIENGENGIFEGEMETNDGRIVGKPGKKLSDGEIAASIDW